MTAWADVRTKGYVVVPAFITALEVDQLIAASAAGARLSRAARQPFQARIELAARLASGLHRVMDRLRTAVFLPASSSDWHTESTPSYIHPDYLSLWIPLRERSGPRVVGFDALAARDPELAARLDGRRSTRIAVVDGRSVVHDSARRERFEIDSNLIEDVAVTPAIAPGDLLVMRSDVLHRTPRDGLAIVFRVISSTTVVTRQQLMEMGSIKFDHMARMRIMFARRFATFQVAQRDSLPVDDYDAIYDELEVREKELCKRLGVTALSNSRFEDLVHDMTLDYARRQAVS